eukprot:scaffold8828_cov204-Amphora_coffeaeformis.AAC.44
MDYEPTSRGLLTDNEHGARHCCNTSVDHIGSSHRRKGGPVVLWAIDALRYVLIDFESLAHLTRRIGWNEVVLVCRILLSMTEGCNKRQCDGE